MAPKKGAAEAKDAGGKASGRRRGSQDKTDDDDDALLNASKGNWWESFVTVSFAKFLCDQVLELINGQEKAPEKGAKGDPPTSGRKEGKASPKSSDDDEMSQADQWKEWAAGYKIPLFLLTVSVLTCALIIGGESIGPRDERVREVTDDYYGTLGVPRDADTGEVKRAYKTLAKRWHPDRNPNCSTCQETFAKIAVAYETLSDDSKRSAYDESGGVASTELTSKRSVPLTRDNFDELVTFSNDVWIVQLFKPDDGSCAQFHPFWENQIQKHGHMVRFGRVDVTSDQGKWLPVKIRVLPMILKFARHLGSPEIFPITAMHETPQMLMKFVLTSFPNIGLPLHADKYALTSWLGGTTKRHKVLFAIPGKSEEERYKSHLVIRKLANRWNEIFEFRTAETATLHKLSEVPSQVKAKLPPADKASNQAAVLFFEAGGGVSAPKAAAVFDWPAGEEDIVLQLLNLAELAAPSLSAQSAELLCRSLAMRRVYCLVLLDPADSAMGKAVAELKDSRAQYMKEVAEIRSQGGEVGEDEDNFIVAVLRLYRQPRIMQPSVATCHAPKYGQVEAALGGATSFLMDFDQGRFAPLKGVSAFRGIYPQIAYEDSLAWVDEVMHPFLSLPDCNEGVMQHVQRGLASASFGELLVHVLTLIVVLEVAAKAAQERSVPWLLGAVVVALLVFLRSPWFLRQVTSYLPGSMLPRPLLVTPA